MAITTILNLHLVPILIIWSFSSSAFLYSYHISRRYLNQ